MKEPEWGPSRGREAVRSDPAPCHGVRADAQALAGPPDPEERPRHCSGVSGLAGEAGLVSHGGRWLAGAPRTGSHHPLEGWAAWSGEHHQPQSLGWKWEWWVGGAAYPHQGPPRKRQPLQPWDPLGVRTKRWHPQDRAGGEEEGPREGPGTFEMGGPPRGHDSRWVSLQDGAQSPARAVGGCCLLVMGREGRVEGGGRGGLGPGTGRRRSRSHSPHFRGCRCWGTCCGCPGRCPEGRCCRHH